MVKKLRVAWNKGMSSKLKKRCATCDKEFYVYPCHKDESFYCSLGCRPAWNKGRAWPDIIKIKISKSTKGRKAPNKGIPHTEKTKQKISKANTGKHWKLSELTKQRIGDSKRGEKAWNWKGDNVGCGALHAWIGRNHGKPKKCSHCGTTTAKRFEWANVSGEYLRDIKDFIRLCVSCHQAFDNRKGGVKI